MVKACKDDDHQLRSSGVVAGFGGGTRTTGAAQDGRGMGWVHLAATFREFS